MTHSGRVFFVTLVISMTVFCALYVFTNTNKAYAAVPNIINFQGRLEDASGTLLGGTSGKNFDFKFSIWDSQSGGTMLWPAPAPSSTTFTVINGVFSVGLGDPALGFAPLNL